MTHFCVKCLCTVSVNNIKITLAYFYIYTIYMYSLIDYSGSTVLQHLLCKQSTHIVVQCSRPVASIIPTTQNHTNFRWIKIGKLGFSFRVYMKSSQVIIIIISSSKIHVILIINHVSNWSILPAGCSHVWVFHQSHSRCCWFYLKASFLLSLSELFPLWPFWLFPLQSV